MLMVVGCIRAFNADVPFHELKVFFQTLDYFWTLYQELATCSPSEGWWVQDLRIADTDSAESDV
jgi:hypothetical protein